MTILARLRRGFVRIGERVKARWDRLRGRRQVTAYQEETARETGAMLGLMAEANSAGAAMSDEQRLLMIRAAPGMRAREAMLLSIPNRSVVEENELHMIRREMAALEGRDAPAGWVSRPRAAVTGFLAPLAAMGGLRLWMVFAGLFALSGVSTAVQTARLNHAKSDLTEVRHDLHAAERALADARETAQQLAGLVRQADAQARESAETIERERRIAERTRQQLRRQANDLETAGRDRGEPIDWGLPVAGGGAQANDH